MLPFASRYLTATCDQRRFCFDALGIIAGIFSVTLVLQYFSDRWVNPRRPATIGEVVSYLQARTLFEHASHGNSWGEIGSRLSWQFCQHNIEPITLSNAKLLLIPIWIKRNYFFGAIKTQNYPDFHLSGIVDDAVSPDRSRRIRTYWLTTALFYPKSSVTFSVP